jgi:hypothetical protein
MHFKFRLESLKGKDHLKDLDMDTGIMLKSILEVIIVRLDLSLTEQGPVVGSCEHFNESSVF